MNIVLAYISIVLLWATTPLAIKWSIGGIDFLSSVSARMIIGTFFTAFFLFIFKKKLYWNKKALFTYCAVALQIYGSMMLVYWSARFIPSGWISVISGLTPLITAFFSAIWLNEKALGIKQFTSYFLGIMGLFLMFGSALQISQQAVSAILGIILAITLQSISAVIIKYFDAKLPALSQVTGGLIIASICYAITWFFSDSQFPTKFTLVNLLCLLYLGIVATTGGFLLYYFLLSKLSATRLSTITLICPVLALYIGFIFNHEMITSKVLIGSFLILGALTLNLTENKKAQEK